MRVGSRRGAAVYIRPDTNGLGPDIAAAAKKDPLLRETIVYLTCVHEIGHALGLPHTDDFRDIMYFFGFGGDIPAFFGRYRVGLRTRADIAGTHGLSEADIERLRGLLRGPLAHPLLHMLKRLLPLVVLLAIGGGVYWYSTRPVTSLTLTGTVTTHEIVVSSQIGGRIEQLLVNEGDTVTEGPAGRRAGAGRAAAGARLLRRQRRRRGLAGGRERSGAAAAGAPDHRPDQAGAGHAGRRGGAAPGRAGAARGRAHRRSNGSSA